MDNKLSDRLARLCEEVSPCETLADIGCDHGYVSMELVRTGKARHVLAMDINEGPLERARENVASAGLSEQIETRLSNGLHNTTETEHFDTILIAGMGGRLMTEILTEGIEKVRAASQLVLQPQSEIFLVRELLLREGFETEREVCLRDREKFYFIINARKASDNGASVEGAAGVDPFFLTYSEYLLRHRDGEYKAFLEKSLKAAGGYLEKAGDKGEKLREEIGELERALSFYK